MKPVVRFLLVLGVIVGLVLWTSPNHSARERAASDVDTWASGDAVAPPPCDDPLAGAARCPGAVDAAAPTSAPGRLVVDLRDGAGAAELARVSALLGAPVAWLAPETEDEALAVVEVPDLAAAAAALRGDPDVEAAEPSVPMRLEEAPAPAPVVAASVFDGAGWPDDPMYTKQWNLRFIHAADAWWLTPRGAGVTVAVLDTGVAAVEDLPAARILPGASFVPGEDDAVDEHGHGTHVAGTIAQETHNGLGVAGVAPAARILPVKVLDASGAGSSEQIAAGIDWAVDHGAAVINLSLGGPVYSEVLHLAAKKARARGVLIVAAVGNNGRAVTSYPGALREVIGVSAFGPDGNIAPYSNYGLGTDISAPGGDKRVAGGGILQDTLAEDGSGHAYREQQGTSMAAPHVSGALAALLSTGAMTPLQAEAALLAGADSALWSPYYGRGRMDLGASLTLLGVGTDRAPRFLLGALVAAMAASLGGMSAGRRIVAAVLGGVIAGGVIGAEHLGGAPGALLARGLLSWPMVWLGPWWGQAPVWISALIPAAAAFVLGPTRVWRPVVIGLAAGVGAHLGWGMAHGAFAPWWMPSSVHGWWLGANVVVCVFVALVIAGVERLTSREGG